MVLMSRIRLHSKWCQVKINQNHFEVGEGSKGWEAVSSLGKFFVHYLFNERYTVQPCQSKLLLDHCGLFSSISEWSGTGSEETS